ncbi:hypothetical protein OIV83_004568 [Microbotryomycetes sp. JL201]|nr:hypothetical protein OIV83_004568 [Microbotryomycetes sp. JL201]
MARYTATIQHSRRSVRSSGARLLACLLAVVYILSLVQPAEAQLSSVLDLTKECQTAAASLLSTPFATCANVLGLARTFAEQGSIIPGFNSWLAQACTTTCTTEEIDQSAATLTNGCEQDLANGSMLAQALVVLVSNYTTFQDFVCLQDAQDDSFCMVDSLESIQNATDTITASALSQIVVNGTASLFPLAASLPPSTICTDCIHGLITQLAPILGPQMVAVAGQVLNSTCGPNFVDGKLPSSVRLAHNDTQATGSATASVASGTASNPGATTSPTSGAHPFFSLDRVVIVAAALLAIWTLA